MNILGHLVDGTFGRHYCRRNGLKFLSPKWLVTKRPCPVVTHKENRMITINTRFAEVQEARFLKIKVKFVLVAPYHSLIVVINLLNSFRLYENLMMVLTRSALVSSSNSDGTFQLGGTCAVDHGLCSVCHGSQQTRDWIQCEKCSQWLHSQCLKKPKEVFVYLSSSENFSYFCDSCVSKKSAFDDSTENATLDELKKDMKTIVENVIEEKLPNKIPISTKDPKTRDRHVPETTITEEKIIITKSEYPELRKWFPSFS